ncbi:MAG: DUF6430 domain-containing protein [Ruminococcus flavefaciens]|nr:DUF6430 domain-containing protein [Ruminococcus flavefaciens]
MRRIWLNKLYIIKLATQWTSGIFAFLGLIGTFVSLSDLLSETLFFYQRVMISVAILLLVWALMCIFCAIYVFKKKRICLFEVSNGYHVYVQYGDIFDANEVILPQERRNIVIPVNRCFDTLVDDDLISSRTLHGMTMKKLYSEGLYTVQSLNDEIQKNLQIQNVESEIICKNDKRSGNLKRFPAGTVAEVKESAKCVYFLLGLSWFDEELHAHTSDEEYVLSLMKLLEFCNTRSQKYPVVMPLIGAGASETKKGEREILEYIVKLIKINKILINSDIHIVVRDSGKESIAITGL